MEGGGQVPDEEGLEEGGLLEDEHPQVLELRHIPQEGEGVGEGGEGWRGVGAPGEEEVQGHLETA